MVGYLVAHVVGQVVQALLEGLGLDRLGQRTRLADDLTAAGLPGPSRLLGRGAYFVVLVAALVQTLADKDGAVRVSAASAMGRLGPAAQDAIPALEQALKVGDAGVRQEAVRTIGKIGTAAEKSFPALVQALKDSDANTREAAAKALGTIALVTTVPKDVIQTLIQLLQDVDVEIKRSGIRALGEIGPKAADAIDRKSVV